MLPGEHLRLTRPKWLSAWALPNPTRPMEAAKRPTKPRCKVAHWGWSWISWLVKPSQGGWPRLSLPAWEPTHTPPPYACYGVLTVASTSNMLANRPPRPRLAASVTAKWRGMQTRRTLHRAGFKGDLCDLLGQAHCRPTTCFLPCSGSPSCQPRRWHQPDRWTAAACGALCWRPKSSGQPATQRL